MKLLKRIIILIIIKKKIYMILNNWKNQWKILLDVKKKKMNLKIMLKKIIELKIDNMKNDILNSGIFEKPMIESKSKLSQKYSTVIHHGIKCNKCGMNPIVGIRYKCMECDNFNFCENCEENVGHPHLFYKIKKNNSLLKN